MLKQHFKMCKSGKRWVTIMIVTVSTISGLVFASNGIEAAAEPATSIVQASVSNTDTKPDSTVTNNNENISVSIKKNDDVQNVTPQASQLSQPSVQNGWLKNEQGQLVYYQEGHSLTGRQYINLPSIPATNVQSDNNWYLLYNGIAQSGVQQWAGSYYYFDPVTYLRVDNDYRQSQWGDWYLFGNDGRVQSGVQQWAGTYYYFDPNTYLRVDNDYRQSQWGDWYMFGPDGRIISGVWNWYGKAYYFDPRTYLKVTNAWADGEYYGYTGARIDGFDYKNATYLVDSVLHKTDEQGQLTNIFNSKKFPKLASLSVDGDLSGITKDNKKVVKLKLTQTNGSQLDAWQQLSGKEIAALHGPKKDIG